MNVFHIVGARPNFIKVAPVMNALKTRKRPITVSLGTNVLVGRDPEKLRFELSRVLSGSAKRGIIPPLWDGHAGERIAALLAG